MKYRIVKESKGGGLVSKIDMKKAVQKVFKSKKVLGGKNEQDNHPIR